MFENYVKQNAPTAAEYAITHALWSNGSPLDSIKVFADHAPVPGIYEAGKAIFEDATRDAAHLLKFAASRREKLVSPYTRTTADYIRVMWETELSPADICDKIVGLI